MATALAQQLRQAASLNATLFKNAASRLNKRDSYLFTAQEASRHDPESIHGFAYNAFLQLESLDPKFSQYEDDLFSDSVKMQDRTLLNPADNEKLNATLDSFLRLLSGHLFLEPSSRVMEWLVRHFRITEFNADGVLACFLPYHDSPLFVRILQILYIKEQRGAVSWAFLEGFRRISQPMPRDALLVAMEKDSDLLRFVVAMLPRALEEGSAHRSLISFYTVTLLAFIKKQGAIDENLSAILLPAFSQLLVYDDADATLGAYMLVVSMSRKTRLTPKALKAILTTLCKNFRASSSAPHLISALVTICASQDALETVQKKTISALAEVSEIEIWLTEACSIVGSEVFLRPLITTMAAQLDDGRYVAILGALFRSNHLPQILVRHSCDVLARQLAAVASEESRASRDSTTELAELLQQRHPAVFSAAVHDTLRNADDADMLHRLEGAVAKLNVAGQDEADGESSLILGAYSADATVRATSTSRILDSLATGVDLTSEDRVSLRAALLSRLADSELEVLQVIYADPAKLMDAIPGEELFAAIKQAISADAQKKQLLLHLAFAASTLITRHPELRDRALFELFLPYLLLTKAHNKTALAAWDLLLDSDIAGLPLLHGIAEPVRGVKQVTEEDETRHGRLAALNVEIAKKLADNIVISDHYQEIVQLFIARLPDDGRATRLFASLVIQALLSRVSGEHQVELGHEVLRFLQGAEEQMFVDGEEASDNLDMDVYSRGKSPRTVRQLNMALLVAIAGIDRPLNVKLDFLCDVDSVVERDMRGLRYVSLCRTAYRLVNKGGSSSPGRSLILKSLFFSLADDVLLLLAGVWSSPTAPADVRATALSHGRAMLQARSGGDMIDFQVILPSLSVALSDPSSSVRAAAIQCLKCFSELYASGRKAKAVFALDLVYGSESGQVQYLERNDVSQYVQLVLNHADEIMLDGAVLRSVHTSGLQREKSEGKKAAAFKEKALYFLLSHIASWKSVYGRTTLLHNLVDVHSSVKLEILLPLVREVLVATRDKDDNRLRLVHSSSASAIPYLLQVFDETAVASLNDPSDASWGIFTSGLKVPLDTAVGQSVYTNMLSILRTDVPKRLNRDRQLELLQLSLDLVATSEQAYTALKQCLTELLDDTSIIADLVKVVRPADEPAERSAKRVKTDSAASAPAESPIRRLSLLVEIVSTKALPGDIALISILLETLGMLVNASSLSNVDVDYTQQLILLAIMNNASALQAETPRSSNALRIDIIVDLIRTTTNPQTSRQALLTVGSLARLSNDSVLHNVMPIFMFMGSTVFQNDDAYSFSVISKTIDSIVPVMAASLRAVQTTKLDLYLRSREFLRVFTDASMHIPRHRRSKFFIHLVDVLGPEDFLVPICMLLADNVAFRAVKQKAVDLPSSFSIPLACLQKRTVAQRLSVLLAVLDECQRLCKKLTNPSHVGPVTFLDMSKTVDSQERVPKPEVVITRQIQALLLFVGTAIELLKSAESSEEPELDTAMQGFVSQLLELTVDPTDGKRDKVISTTAFACLDKALNVVSVPTFAHAIESMLGADDHVLQSAALSLIGRLNNVTAKARRSIATTMANIIRHVVTVIKQSEHDSTKMHGLQALEIVSRTAMAGEESALAQAVGPIIEVAREKQGPEQLLVLKVLDILIGKLGPRLIPNLLPIIELCGSIIGVSADTGLRKDAFGALAGLMKALPNFIGSYLPRILDISLDVSRALPDDLETARQAVLRSMAKNIKGKTLLPALENLWEQRAQDKAPPVKFMSLYLDLLQRALRSADRAEVMAQLRPLFKLFLDIFDVRTKFYSRRATEEFVSVESLGVAAFIQVVVKLNETAFKPLFRRLYDWQLEGAQATRQITFFRLFGALLDQLKAIITPYMSILFDHTIELLRGYSAGKAESGELWLELMDVLRKSFDCDEGAFWRDNTMTKVMPTLVDQIDACPSITAPTYSSISPGDALASCLASFSKASSDDVAKALNLTVWMKARSESVDARLVMLKAAQAIWKRDGERLSSSGYAAETVAFLVECLEDPSEAVENEARAFQRQLTKLVGPLEGLIE